MLLSKRTDCLPAKGPRRKRKSIVVVSKAFCHNKEGEQIPVPASAIPSLTTTTVDAMCSLAN